MKIAVDLDGTLSNEDFGKEMEDKNIDAQDREGLKNMVSTFTPKKGIEILNKLNIEPVIITGRIEYLRDVTEIWLFNNDVPYSELVMITIDYYPNNEIDWKMYQTFKVDEHKKRDIELAFDDKPNIVSLLNKNGISTFLVKDDFAEAVEEALEL